MMRLVRFLLFAGALAVTHRASSAPCYALRPTSEAADWSYAGARTASFASPGGDVRVWYAIEGEHAPTGLSPAATPAGVLDAADAADAALARYDALGFRRPLSDSESPCADHGGDGRIDVYLFDFGAADGTIILEACEQSAVEACAGFILVENDFSMGAYSSATEGFQTVVPHELFHLIQRAYSSNGEAWWSEGTAQWAAQLVYPELRDLERFLPAFFENTDRALDFPPIGAAASISYGAAIWPVFLQQRIDAALPRAIFEQLATGSASVLAATSITLEARAANLGATFAEFARFNAATGARSSDDGYVRAADYPLVALEPFADGAAEGKLAGLAARYFARAGGNARRLVLTGDAARVAAWFVPLTGGAADLSAAAELPIEGGDAGIVIVSGKAVDRRDTSFRLTETALSDVGIADGGAAGAAGDASAGATCGVEPPAGEVGAGGAGSTLELPLPGAAGSEGSDHTDELEPRARSSDARASGGCAVRSSSPPPSSAALVALIGLTALSARKRRLTSACQGTRS